MINKKLRMSINIFFISIWILDLEMANLIKFVQMEYKQLNIDDISFLKKLLVVSTYFQTLCNSLIMDMMKLKIYPFLQK